MIYIFIHQNFPGQYKHLVRHLASDSSNTVYFISRPNSNWIEGVIKLVYDPNIPSTLDCHPYVVDFDLAVRHGAGVAKTLEILKKQGVRPDIVIGHSGWGETLFVKDIFPDVPLLAYFEFYYHGSGVDTDFDPEFPPIYDDASRMRCRNVVNQVSFQSADWGNSPTLWQKSLYPSQMQSRISVLHEGIDTNLVRPNQDAWMQLGRGNLILRSEDEVITFVSRNLEPYRGFHIFMRALPEILRRRPRAHVLIVGGDEVSYGMAMPSGITYRQKMIEEQGSELDMSRVHFLGQLAYESYLNLLHISSVHVYLTYPFVLSWSFLEAMASGCAIVGSATPPVEEVLRNGKNGLLVDFFSPDEIADRVDEVLEHPDRMQHMRDNARQTIVDSYDLHRHQLPRWLGLIADLVAGRRPCSPDNEFDYRFLTEHNARRRGIV